MSIRDEVLAANDEYAADFGSKGGLAFPRAIRGLLANSLETAALAPDGFTDVGNGSGSAEAEFVDWLTITDNARSVVEDVTRIRSHPLVPARIPIYGYIYDVSTGRLVEVRAATAAGKAA